MREKVIYSLKKNIIFNENSTVTIPPDKRKNTIEFRMGAILELCCNAHSGKNRVAVRIHPGSIFVYDASTLAYIDEIRIPQTTTSNKIIDFTPQGNIVLATPEKIIYYQYDDTTQKYTEKILFSKQVPKGTVTISHIAYDRSNCIYALATIQDQQKTTTKIIKWNKYSAIPMEIANKKNRQIAASGPLCWDRTRTILAAITEPITAKTITKHPTIFNFRIPQFTTNSISDALYTAFTILRKQPNP